MAVSAARLAPSRHLRARPRPACGHGGAKHAPAAPVLAKALGTAHIRSVQNRFEPATMKGWALTAMMMRSAAAAQQHQALAGVGAGKPAPDPEAEAPRSAPSSHRCHMALGRVGTGQRAEGRRDPPLHRVGSIDIAAMGNAERQRHGQHARHVCPSSCCGAGPAPPPRELARQSTPRASGRRIRARLPRATAWSAWRGPSTWAGSPPRSAAGGAISASFEAGSLGSTAFDHRQALHRLDCRARVDRPLDIAASTDHPAARPDNGKGTLMTALDKAAADDLGDRDAGAPADSRAGMRRRRAARNHRSASACAVKQMARAAR